MKFDLLLPLTLLLNSTFNKIAEKFAPIDGTVTLPDAATIRVPELNTDVLRLIIDELDLPEIIETAAANSVLNSVAKAVFRQRYGNYEIKILKTRTEYDGEGDEEESYRIHNDGHEQIEINDFKIATDILRYFGDEIHTLTISNYNLNNAHSVIVNKLANAYGSESIVELHMTNIKENTLEQFTKPFKNVESLTGLISVNQSGDNILPFNELFPKLQRFFLTLSQDIEYKYITTNIPSLESFHVAIGLSVNSHCEQIEDFLSKNSQIREIDISFFPYDFVEIIHKHLEKLENLTLDEFYIEEDILFTHVKNFVLHDTTPVKLNKIKFSRLESLKMVIDEEEFNSYFDDWSQFFGNNTYLRKLHVEGAHNDERLVDLFVRLPNLEEITLESIDWLSVDVISGIIKSHEKLLQFDLSMNDEDEEDIETLRKMFESDWNISATTYSLWTEISFERKNSTLLE